MPVQLAGFYAGSYYPQPRYFRTVPEPLPRRKSAPASLAPEGPLEGDPLPRNGNFDPMVASVGYDGQWVTPEDPTMPLLWSSAHFRGIIESSQGAGLANLGNTCFMNAALQALLYCPPVAGLLVGKRHRQPAARCVEKCVLCALQHLAAMMLKRTGVVAPYQLRALLRDVCSGFQPGSQEDAHEFVRGLLDAITRVEMAGCAALKRGIRLTPGMEMRSNVHRLFGGMLQSCVQCTSCGHRSTNLEPFLDLSLEISRGKPGIIQALRKFTAPERLAGDNPYRCSGCRKMVNANKRMTIRRAPNVLTLHIKRFNWEGRKTQGFVPYPEVLNLGPFMPGRPNSPAPRYRLSSVLVHTGGSRSGHYFSFVHGSDGRWYRKDDSRSIPVSVETVMKQHAYLLLYTRLPTPPGWRSSERCQQSDPEPVRPAAPAQASAQPRDLTGPTEKITPRASAAQTRKPEKAEHIPVQASPRIASSAEEPPPQKKTGGNDRRKAMDVLIGGSATVTKILQRVFGLQAAIRLKRKRCSQEEEPQRKRFRFRRRHGQMEGNVPA